MPKTKTPRMQGWRGRSYDPKNWESDPRAEQMGDPMRTEDPERRFRTNAARSVGSGKFSRGSK